LCVNADAIRIGKSENKNSNNVDGLPIRQVNKLLIRGVEILQLVAFVDPAAARSGHAWSSNESERLPS
jgi:hypothetical protein